LPPSEVVGLKEGPDTLTIEEKRDGFELDLVTCGEADADIVG